MDNKQMSAHTPGPCPTCKATNRNDGGYPWAHCDCGASWNWSDIVARLADMLAALPKLQRCNFTRRVQS